MSDEPEKRTPPYIPFATFDNFVNGLAETAVPHKIDSSLLGSMSGSTRSGLMAALRYLGLVDENDNTKPELEKLATSNAEERKAVLQALIGRSYPFMNNGSLDLKRATPAQLADAVGSEGATGGTRDKAVGFFLRAAEYSGIEVSPHILKRKHATRPNKKPKRSPAKRSPKGKDEHPPKKDASVRTPYEVLMHEIYDPADMQEGSPEEKAVFTLARYLRSKKAGS